MRPGLRRSKMSFDQQISYRPLAENRCGAFCMICRRPSDEEQIVEERRGDHNFARVLVRCHGAEELREFPFGSSDWDDSDIKRAMQRSAWFDPGTHADVGGIPNAGIVNEPGDIVEPIAPKGAA